MSKPTVEEFIETLAIPLDQLGSGMKCMLSQLFNLIVQYGGEMEDILAHSLQHPSVYMRPNLSIDGNQWCAHYGWNLHDGVAGFGDTPAEAMKDFDRVWYEKLVPAELESTT